VYGQAVTIIVFGYDGREDMPELFEGVNYEFVSSVSIVHYFKQLKSLNLDVLFIPLINNLYNATSENYNKYLEASVFKIPVIVTDIHPYNTIIQHNHNGFIYKEKEDLMEAVKYMLTNRHMIEYVGENAFNDLRDNFDFSEENIRVISSVYN
jgi:glycosyltransferase involved in cell wall biosynthesis